MGKDSPQAETVRVLLKAVDELEKAAGCCIGGEEQGLFLEIERHRFALIALVRRILDGAGSV